MTHSSFFWIFLSFYLLHQTVEIALLLLNRRHLQRNRHEVPLHFREKISLETYQKTIQYNLDRLRFGLLTDLLAIAMTWFALASGVFSKIELLIPSTFSSSSLTYSVLYCSLVGLGLLILQIPASIYSNFVLEAKYGFNRMTAPIFLIDLVKSLVLGALFGVPLLYLLFYLYQRAEAGWWLWGFCAFFGFQLFLAAIFPTFLAPLFNKFTPLQEGSLKEAILKIAQRIQFKLSGIFVIDGSKRSSHSNAYFAGLGRFRRIVLFDTLVNDFSEPEIVAVIAHEMGHNKKRHIQKQLLFSLIATLAGFYLLSLAIDWRPFYQAFNAGAPAPHKALILLSLFAGHFTFFLTPFSNWLSRKYEYEADRFSVETTRDPSSMSSSLVKLSEKNLSNLTPHPLYSFYHYTHPTTLERIQAIEKSS